MKIFKIVSLLLITSINLSAQPTKQELRNLIAFTKVYGYINYFHPSDEARKLSWDKLAITGSKSVMEARNDEELLQTLNHLFKPVAPSVKVFSTADNLNFSKKEITPPDVKRLYSVFWQHQGLYTGNTPSYASIRFNRRNQMDTIPLSPPLNLKDYAGKKFIFSFDIENKSTDSLNSLVIQPKTGFENIGILKPDTIHPGEKKRIRLTGILDDKKNTAFQAFVNPQIPEIAAGNSKLEILNIKSVLSIPLDSVPGKWLSSASGNEPQSLYGLEMATTTGGALFNKKVSIGEYIREEIIPGISCIVPLALYGDDVSTYPKADTVVLNKLIGAIDEEFESLKSLKPRITADLLPVRLGNIVIAWNTLQHSFPYWEDASSPSEIVLNNALKKCFLDQTADDFFVTLKLMSAALNDGHMFVANYNDSLENGSLPVILSIVKDKVVVKKILSDSLKGFLKPGDVVKKVDDIPALRILEAKEALLSGSLQWKRSKALTTFFSGARNSAATITVSRNGRRKKVLLKRNSPYEGYRSGTAAYDQITGWTKPGIFYFDLTRDTLVYSADLVEKFRKANSIIFDLRGYPSCSQTYENIIPLLLKKRETESSMFIPKIVYPDFKNVIYNKDTTVLEPAGINLDGRIYFLTDATAQSASETILGRVKDFNLGTIIGEPTSGTNGNLNTISLWSDFSFSFSGMLVKNNDGSKHHLIGILPDHYVKETIRGIKAGKDEALNKAIELAQKQL